MTYSFQQWICSGTNRKKGERSSINFFLTRLTNPATLAVVQTVVSRVYYDLKAGRTAALLGPEAARFGYTCVVCGRQYKQLARHVDAAHRHSNFIKAPEPDMKYRHLGGVGVQPRTGDKQRHDSRPGSTVLLRHH